MVELASLEVDEQGRKDLEKEVGRSLESYRKLAESLSQRRKLWADQLAKRIETELADLALGKARFTTVLQTPTSAR